MLWPIVCFTCGKQLSTYHKNYWEQIKKTNKTSKEVLDNLKLNRICCRRMVVTSVDLSGDFPFVI